MRRALVLPLLVTLGAVASGPFPAAQQASSSSQPARDTPSQQPAKPDAGRIAGRVLAADTGQPVKRARVLLNAAELPGGRGMLTDDQGLFDFTELPQGRYTLAVSKNGFVSLAYGQRRPLQPGTPLQLNDGQEIRGLEFRLPRGSVIAGHVFDESGEPLPGATVRAMSYRYAQGSRQLVPAGNAQTDDRGEYRIWGLNPGEYYITAIARNFNFNQNGPFSGRGGRGAPPRSPNVGGTPAPPPQATDAPEQSGYAPTYYPGVESVAEARAIALPLSAEMLDINFGVLLVHTSRVSGRVVAADGTEVSTGDIVLTPEGQTARPGGGTGFGTRINWDGAFAIVNVPPGRYLLRARGDDWELPQFAMMPLAVAGDVSGLNVVVNPGASIAGAITLQRSRSASADVTQFRITAPSTDDGNLGPQRTARADSTGRFTLEGVAVGAHWIRAQAPRGWALKSVTADGRDITDSPVDLRSGQQLGNVSVVFTDKLAEINGVVSDERGTPITDFTMLAFPIESGLWMPQSRHIMTARPDQNGTFQIRGLPAGEYFLAAVDPTEAGEWFEPAYLDAHRASAVRLTLADGDVKTQNIKIATGR